MPPIEIGAEVITMGGHIGWVEHIDTSWAEIRTNPEYASWATPARLWEPADTLIACQT